MEPPAVLVAALGIEVAGEAQLGLRFQNGCPACAGVDPDIEDVGLAAELGAAAAGCRTLHAAGQELLRRPVVPGVGAMLLEELDDARICVGRLERLIAFPTEEERDGHAPDALA